MGASKQRESTLPPQHQDRFPGVESEMRPKPREKGEWYKGSGKLTGRTAIITGGDSGIGRSVAIFFAREGADSAVVYYNEHEDAQETKRMVEAEGRRCLLFAGDVGSSAFCRMAVEQTVREFGYLDIVVNNAAYQPYQNNLETLTDEQLASTFRTNIFSYFYMAREAMKYLREGSTIINTTSVTAYRGSPHFLDYSSSKGAIVSFTRSLAIILASRGIRVNGVAPGPIWTPLIPSSMPAEQVQSFGQKVALKRPGEPEEVAPAFVFLASRDSGYMTGQVIHPNGGEIING
jgi:NAD(P)-dependent dehydrogenase (short-subunit alcohol dehydrogenase family)